jgi:divalent metal cation (Fe/Co/Zn/Cd) transporter
MKTAPGKEFPPEQAVSLRTARRLEWTTLAYMTSVVIGMYFVMGTSQAMKTVWVEDLLSFIPPTVFLVATNIASWEPTEQFPYGFHRVTSIAFLCGAITLLTLGLWLLGDAALKLVEGRRPTIGGVTIFQQTFWLGWLMIAALLYSAIPSAILGHYKKPLAYSMHDKILFVDAKMNRADWLSASAAIVGILGIGGGYWWADSVAAGFVSFEIVHDGYQNVKQAVFDLMNEKPKAVDHSENEPLPEELTDYLNRLPWVKNAAVRVREEGHVFFGEAFVQVEQGFDDLPEQVEAAIHGCIDLDWRLHDMMIVPVKSLEQEHVRSRD